MNKLIRELRMDLDALRAVHPQLEDAAARMPWDEEKRLAVADNAGQIKYAERALDHAKRISGVK